MGSLLDAIRIQTIQMATDGSHLVTRLKITNVQVIVLVATLATISRSMICLPPPHRPKVRTKSLSTSHQRVVLQTSRVFGMRLPLESNGQTATCGQGLTKLIQNGALSKEMSSHLNNFFSE